MAKRSAQEIIDAALADNRWWERLCFGLVVLFVAVGLTTLGVGLVRESDTVVVTGGIVTALFVPAIGVARSLRERNMRIRMSEAAVSLAKTANEVRDILNDTFGASKGAGS